MDIYKYGPWGALHSDYLVLLQDLVMNTQNSHIFLVIIFIGINNFDDKTKESFVCHKLLLPKQEQ